MEALLNKSNVKGSGKGGGILPIPPKKPGYEDGSQGNLDKQYSLPKIVLQYFEGNNPRGWLRKCQNYFDIYQIPDY